MKVDKISSKTNLKDGDDFIADSVRQLKSGLTVYVFPEDQVNEIKKIMGQDYKVELKINFDDFCYEIIPLRRISKYISY